MSRVTELSGMRPRSSRLVGVAAADAGGRFRRFVRLLIGRRVSPVHWMMFPIASIVFAARVAAPRFVTSLALSRRVRPFVEAVVGLLGAVVPVGCSS